MKQLLLVIILGWPTLLSAQEEIQPLAKWRAYISISQNPGVLVVPKFNPIHPGIQLGAIYQWNKHQKHRLIQNLNGGFMYHNQVQKAVQLYTEIGYELRLNQFSIVPLVLGGGYVFSVSDLTTLKWDPTTSEYEEIKTSIRHNWIISLGPSLGYETSLSISERPISIILDYRIQVQGIFIRDSSPFMAYAPIRIGVSVPISKSNVAK